MRQRATSRGVTLIELMVVVGIIGVLVTLGFWGFAGVIPGYRLNVAARDVANVLVLTRAKAISQNRHYIVEFQANGYRLIWDESNFETIDPDDDILESRTYGSGVTYIPDLPTGPPDNFVAFDPRGLARNIPLSVGGDIVLTNASGQIRVTVRYTGLVQKRKQT